MWKMVADSPWKPDSGLLPKALSDVATRDSKEATSRKRRKKKRRADCFNAEEDC